MNEIEKILDTLQTDLAGFIVKSKDEHKLFGDATVETKAQLKEIQERIDTWEQKLITLPGRGQVKSFGELLQEQESVKQILKGARGKHRISITPDIVQAFELEKKAIITTSTLGYSTPGVMPTDRHPYVEEARHALSMRDVIPVRATTAGHLYWPAAGDTGTKASPVAEAALKPMNNFDPTVHEQRVKTIATLFKASRQSLEDWNELLGILTRLLEWKIREEEDRQILYGDNTGENLNGLTTQAQDWDLSILTASDGYDYVDIIGGAAAQIADDDEIEPSFVVLHPMDMWKVRMQKTTGGDYAFGDPSSPFPPNIWGLRPVSTTQMIRGNFLVGSSSPMAAEIRQRVGIEVMISTEDDLNFQYNLVTIRAESRIALCVYRPDAFVYGALTQSPV